MALTLTKALPSLVRPTRHARTTVTHGGIRSLTQCRAEKRATSSGRPEEEPDLLLQACPVPKDQQPMMEFKQLQDAFLFDWPLQTFPEFCMRLGGVFLGFFLLVGLPISVLTFSVHDELVQVLAASSIGSGFITLLLVLRLYIGYSHVSSRLLSATVEYEETGWYDGQVWVKTPQMLMRDRLLGTYQVRPVLQNLKRTLLGLSGAMAAAIVLLATGPTPKAYSSEVRSYPGPADVPLAASQQDYDSRVAAFEPWGMEDEDEGEGLQAGRPTLLDHMK